MNESVNVAYLESELRRMWEDLSSANQKNDEQAVTRACVHNLIVFAPGEHADAEVTSLVGEITVQNPGRALILLPESGATSPDSISAWVTAQCYITSGKRQQVCCEQIMMRGGEQAIERLSSIVIPLLVPDVPVFLLWRSPLNNHSALLMDLLDVTDRWIIDSALFRNFDSACRCLDIKPDTHYALSDLNWARLTPWRSLVASFFDSPDTLAHLNEMKEVEIAGSLKNGAPWLLASWIGSRLKLKLDGPVRREADRTTFDCSGIHFELVDTKAGRGMESMKIRSRKNGMFVAAAASDDSHLHGTIHIDSNTVTISQRFNAESEAELVRRELLILGRDKVYENSLIFLKSLLSKKP